MQLNTEKLEILRHKGNTLVIANPGTGKTLLLAHKYARLIKDGADPKEILCLTFTNKAKDEMEDRIITILKAEGMEIDYGNLNIFTFHSYALNEIGREETIQPNLLRYAIYKYLKENEILRYDDAYLIDAIVPKMENLIRYLKSFGVLPEDIDVNLVKEQLTDFRKLSKEEMDRFAECFVDIYRHYEEVKRGRGIDYADMLLEFMKLKAKRRFKYVLVDELQDVNTMEADIALQSGETFFAVGDKKQAIFGFQGGSTLNFKKFNKAKTFILSENFRSTNAILNYAKAYLISKTKDEGHKKELEGLQNLEAPGGKKPVIYEVADENIPAAVCELASRLCKKYKEIAVIARTNQQILRISQELQKMGIDHSSTYFSASNYAKMHIITFLKGVLSNEPNDIRNAMFTPFFPIPLQDAFRLSELGDRLTLEMIYEKSPEFKQMRESVKTIEDVNRLFTERIFPVALAYGKEYLLAAKAIHESFNETLSVLEKISFTEVVNYLKASDMPADESEIKKQITVTTVHKAKGREFDAVIYVPQRVRESGSFQDEVVKAILRTKRLNIEEELDEEHLRINFVALTRPKQELYIITDKATDYVNDFCVVDKLNVGGLEASETVERLKKAYTLFVNGAVDKSQKLLADNRTWVIPSVRKHFENLKRISFSSLRTDPCDYLKYNILGLKEFSPAIALGSEVHAIAHAMVSGEEFETTERTKPYAENIAAILSEIRKEYPESIATEQKICIQLEKLMGNGSDIMFAGVVDAVFRNGDSYLIIDWKTDKSEDRGHEHRQQLEAYRRAFSISSKIQPEKIKTAIAYIGLRTTVNLGRIEWKLDMRQPSKSAFETFSKEVSKILAWKTEPELFFKELMENKCDDPICKAVIEEYERERSRANI